MKLIGQETLQVMPEPKLVQFARPEGVLTFTCRAVIGGIDQYEEHFPKPENKKKTMRETGEVIDLGPDEKKLARWAANMDCWMVYMSITDENVEWANVDPKKYETLGNVKKELCKFLSDGEYAHLANTVLEISLPNKEAIEDSLKVFMEKQEEKLQASQESQTNEATPT